ARGPGAGAGAGHDLVRAQDLERRPAVARVRRLLGRDPRHLLQDGGHAARVVAFLPCGRRARDRARRARLSAYCKCPSYSGGRQMTANRRTLWLGIALVALLQAGALLWMIWDRASLLANGREIVLDVVPVDPRSLFRGDYVILGYDISRFNTEGNVVP